MKKLTLKGYITIALVGVLALVGAFGMIFKNEISKNQRDVELYERVNEYVNDKYGNEGYEMDTFDVVHTYENGDRICKVRVTAQDDSWSWIENIEITE